MIQYFLSLYPLLLAPCLTHTGPPTPGIQQHKPPAHSRTHILACCCLQSRRQSWEAYFIWSQKMKCSHHLPTKARLFPLEQVQAKTPNSISSLKDPTFFSKFYLAGHCLPVPPLPPHHVLTDLVAPSMPLGTCPLTIRGHHVFAVTKSFLLQHQIILTIQDIPLSYYES